MQHVASPTGVRLSYESYGSGPPLLLVHGSFDNHQTNWARVNPLLAERFAIYAAAAGAAAKPRQPKATPPKATPSRMRPRTLLR